MTGKYEGSTDGIKHLKKIMELMTCLTRDTRFREAYEERMRKGEEVGNVCEWIDELEEKGRQEGRQEGLMEKIIGLSLRKFRRGLSVDEAADALETEPAEIAEIYAAIEACGADSEPKAIMDWLDERKRLAPAGA